VIQRKIFGMAMLFAAIALVATSPARSNSSYPNKPIRILIPFEPGGPTDLFVRAIAPIMTQELKQNIIIENKPGAGGSIAAAYVARSPGDGYTLLAGGSPTVLTPHFIPGVPFDAKRDFTAVAPLCITPYYLVVNQKLPVNSVHDLVEMAKKSPGSVTYASSGVGNGPHVAGARFGVLTDTKLTHVPYKGTAPATNDLLAGRVTFMFLSMTTVRGYIQSGLLKVLAVATPQRDPEFPDVPTLAEVGLPNFYPKVWYGLLAPSGMPEEAKKKINLAVAHALREPAVVKQYAKYGANPFVSGVQKFQSFYDDDIKQWHDFFESHPDLLKK